MGGVSPYTYSWSGGDSTVNRYDLGPSEDTLIVTDANGCTSVARATLVARTDYYCTDCANNSSSSLCGSYYACSSGCTGTVTRNIVADFGAIPDDNNSDQCAFEEAAYFFEHLDPNTLKVLNIPAGVYDVGEQHNTSTYYLDGNPVMCFMNINYLTIIGETTPTLKHIPTSVLRLNKCLRYGMFDPVTGDRLIGPGACAPSGGCAPFGPNDHQKMAQIAPIIQLTNCDYAKIMNLNLDGNIDNTIIGGGYTEGIQLPYDGIILSECSQATLSNLVVHHFGHDGLWIKFRFCNENIISNKHLNLKLDYCTFDYNGRNGVSWTGGTGLFAYRCQFNHTGLSRIRSKPYDGIDIEWETWQDVAIGDFKECKFMFNYSNGMECNAGQTPNIAADLHTGNLTFTNCLFISGENNYAVWPNGRNFLFENCNFAGPINHTYDAPYHLFSNNFQTVFKACHFDDEWPNATVHGTPAFYFNHLPNEFAVGSFPCPVNQGNPNYIQHDYLVTVQSARTQFLNCVINTNYTTKFTFFRGK